MFKLSFRAKFLGATVLSLALVVSGLLVSIAPAGAATSASSVALGPEVSTVSDPVANTTTSSPNQIPPGFADQGNGSYVNPTSILAYRKANVTPAQVAQRFSTVDNQVATPKGAGKLDSNDASSRLVTATVPAGSSQAVMQSMNASGLYDGVQLNGLVFPQAQYTSTPDDPAFRVPVGNHDGSYALKDGPGGSYFDQVWPSLAAGAPSASAPIAVLDTGFDLADTDFVGSNVTAGWNVADNNSDVSPCNGNNFHGTATAGIIGARTNNGVGIAGAGYDATVKVYRISLSTATTCGPSTDWFIASGINRAVQDGARVINISFGGSYDYYPTVMCNAITDATRAGTLVVVSSGDNGDKGNPVDYPAACPDALSVTNTTQTGALVSDANTASNVAIAAGGDGVAILTPNNELSYGNGTSYSAPHVAAAASLLMRLVPTASISQIRAALIGNGNPVTGSPQATYKILDVKKAYDALVRSPLLVASDWVSLAGTANSSANVMMTSVGNWTATSNQSWLTVSPASGTAGTRSVTFTAGANTTISSRTATVTFNGPSNSTFVATVTQAEPPLSVSPSSVSLASTANSSANVTVRSPGAWTASSNQAWLTLSRASGSTGDSAVVLVAGPNTTAGVRVAMVTFSGPNGSTATVTVTQAEPPPPLSVSSSSVSIPGDPLGTGNVTVTATGSWTASSNQSWLTISPPAGGAGSTRVTLGVREQNLTGAARTATVTFNGPNGSSVTVAVTQTVLPVAVSFYGWNPFAEASGCVRKFVGGQGAGR